MKDFLKEILKHLFIYGLFIKNNIMSQMEYRANFFTGIAMEIGFLFVKILYPIIIYMSGTKIKGFTPDEFLIFVGTFVIMTGFYAGLLMMNFFAFRYLIIEGTLDIMITRPISLQFISTLKHTDLGIFLTDVIAGIAMIVIGISRTGIPISFFKILIYAVFIGSGLMITYSLFLIPEILNFWFFSAGIAETISSFWDFNIVPMIIYDKIIQQIGIFIFPILVITNFPVLFMLDKLSPFYLFWGIFVSVLLMILCRTFWKFAIKNYTSASS
jgi:ABC-2 type transport system permease protein